MIDIEPKVFNTAYMQIAAFHKACGDTVGWWTPMFNKQFDVVYCSSLFDFTDKSGVPDRAICGGTGFHIESRLSQAMEAAPLDYSIYPECDTSFIRFSRGCIRRCPWCVVPQKEGGIRPVETKNLNPAGKYITVCDNNFFANPLWAEAIEQLEQWGEPVDFQGIDIRTLIADMVIKLRGLRHHKQIKFAWDNPREDLTNYILWLIKMIPAWQLMCYVLIGFDSTGDQDLYRIETLRSLKIDPFVMPFDKSDPYQRRLARYVNHKAVFKSCSWDEYQKDKVLN